MGGDFTAVLAAPLDGRRRRAVGVALEGHVAAFSDDDVGAAAAVVDAGGDDDVEVGRLGFGLRRVDLAEVATAVGLLDVAEVQVPRALVLVGYLNPRVPRDDVGVHRQDRRPLKVDPCHLKSTIFFNLLIHILALIFKSYY